MPQILESVPKTMPNTSRNAVNATYCTLGKRDYFKI